MNMIHFIQSLVLGVVEGITEFLPISSTAHLVLVSEAMRIEQSDFQKSFEIIIQLGAILAVVVLYFKKFFNWEILKRLVVAFIPTGVIGLLLYEVVKKYLLGNTSVILWALFLGGLFLIVFDKLHKEKPDATDDLTKISYVQCLWLGAFQAIAMIPGVSRSAATIVGGLLLGLKRRTIIEFSFLLAVPTMAAATGLDLIKSADAFSSSDFGLLAVGFVAAFITAVLAIKFFLSYVRKHTFTLFGWYRIGLVALVLVVMAIAK
jgi:undecaprenyl-diphosphatase